MIQIPYKHKFKANHLTKTLFSDEKIINECQDSTFQNVVNTSNLLIFSAIESFNENDFDSFFEIVEKMVSFFDRLYHEESFDIDSIFPEIYNPDFNAYLIYSINPNFYTPPNIHEVLALISTISSFPSNFQFFRNSSIFDIVYNLLELQEPMVYLECLLLINQYIVIFQTTEFPYEIPSFLQKLKDISNYSNIIKYIPETLNLLLIYVDVHKYLDYILSFLNQILNKIQSRHGINDIINSLIYVVKEDPNNYSRIFQSKIIHTFINLLQTYFVPNFDHYQFIILNFFKFLKKSFDKIDYQWQTKTIKLIGVDTFNLIFDEIQDQNEIFEKIILKIHLIMFKYFQSTCNINDELPFFTMMLNSGFIPNLFQIFDFQNFEMKKEIIIAVSHLLKTQNQELFSQLLKYDEDANYIEVCADFVMATSDSSVHIAFLESLIDLVLIGQKNNEQYLITDSPIVDEYITSCLTFEDENVQKLAYHFFDVTTTE